MYQKYLPALLHNPLFRGMSQDELSELFHKLNPQTLFFEKKELVFIEGDSVRGIWVILEGTVNIVKESLAGGRMILAKLSRGDLFGEAASLAAGGLAVATAEAQTPARLLLIPTEKIIGKAGCACAGYQRMLQNILSILANKAMGLNKKISYLMIRGMRSRISAFLLSLHRKSGRTELTLPFNRNDMADYLGVSRPSLSREMGRMRDEGLIRFQGRKILLQDIEALARCVD